MKMKPTGNVSYLRKQKIETLIDTNEVYNTLLKEIFAQQIHVEIILR
jgi:hypothetical protein